MGGDISVESVLGDGAVFTLTLPRVLRDAPLVDGIVGLSAPIRLPS